jgi:multicomponent Na+:H+ antiporter subunit B
MKGIYRAIYISAGIAFGVKMILLSEPLSNLDSGVIMQAITQESGVTNAVAGILFRNRLYDTIFEVLIFTMAIMGANFLLANETPLATIYRVNDKPSIVLAQLGATIAALVGIELAIRGHLSPGGGFAAGVAGGNAIALITVTTPFEPMHSLYKHWQVATWEKISVLVFIILALISLAGVTLPKGELGTLVSGGMIPVLNILVAIKVALGSWSVILLFIRYRGLL